jgi:hypothetical protein
VDTGGLAAVKLLRDAKRTRDLVRHYFAREGRAVRRLAHPHIVPIYELGDDYIVSAYLDGGALARRLREPMPARNVIRVATQIAAALAHAHERGVVHRDVKPANILLDSRGSAYLADFGLALLDDVSLDPGLACAGTPAFMAPEQRRGDRVTAAADQYALGRTLLAMLLGDSCPPSAEVALAQLPDATPDALRAVLRRATAVEPSARYATAAELGEALARIGECDVTAAPRLAREVRPRSAYTWAAGAYEVVRAAPDFVTARYRLRDLANRASAPGAALDALLARHDLRDLGFNVTARTSRLGSVADCAAWARAAEVVVLLHGMYVPIETWDESARAICRDNAEAIVVVPDTLGHGDAQFGRRRPARENVDLARWMLTLREILAVLGIGNLPMVLVGHSMMATTLMAVNDDELGPRVSRIAINPVWPEDQKLFNVALRLQLLGHAALRPLRAWLRYVLRAAVASAPQCRGLSRALRHRIVDTMARMPAGVIAALARSLSTLRLSRGPHRRLEVICSMSDPYVPGKASKRGLTRLGLGAGQVRRLASTSHFPQLVLEPHPEHTARNVDEIVHAADRMLLSARESTLFDAAMQLEETRSVELVD